MAAGEGEYRKRSISIQRYRERDSGGVDLFNDVVVGCNEASFLAGATTGSVRSFRRGLSSRD